MIQSDLGTAASWLRTYKDGYNFSGLHLGAVSVIVHPQPVIICSYFHSSIFSIMCVCGELINVCLCIYTYICMYNYFFLLLEYAD